MALTAIQEPARQTDVGGGDAFSHAATRNMSCCAVGAWPPGCTLRLNGAGVVRPDAFDGCL